MSVLGFDIGNENCVIAAVKQRGIDVLLNDESKRETPAVVSFGDKQRFLGSAGAASATMNPRSTISQVKRLIGRNFDQPGVQEDLRRFPFETSKAPDGEILIHLQYMGERHTFSPVQILAMLLSHLKQMAEKNLETQVSDCVIGIPSYFTELQRRLYLDAATIAGLKPLRLMHECTATALGYGIYKTDLSSSGSTNVVFVDIGHSDTQVAVVSFRTGHMKILSHAFDSNLGGRDFDEVLFCHFATQFKEQYNIDLYSSPRACIRLRAACEKLKKVLSANPEAPLQIECLMDEKDVKGFIRRDEFEKLASNLLDRIAIPCRQALNDAGVTADKIHSVELVGSGSRIPAINRLLASIFRREPSRTLNASECVARGCAVQCAMLSSIFRVKEYEVEDSLPFSVGFCLPDEGPIEAAPNGVLFPKGHPIPSDKVLTLHKRSTFQLEAVYANQHELPPGVSPKISLFMIGPFELPQSENVKVKVKARLTLHGTITLASALINDNKVKAAHRSDIPIKEVVYGATTHEKLLEAQQKEFQLAQQDDKVEQAKDKKNALESFVYETRDKLFNTYRGFATELEKEGISKNLQQTEDWLYEEGDDESANVYSARLQDLKKLVDPIENRYKDTEARAAVTKELVDCISRHRAAAQSLPPSVKEAVLAECASAEQWLQEKSQEQDLQPKNVDPVICSSEIKARAEALNTKLKQIMKSRGHPQTPENTRYSDHTTHGDDMQVD